MKFKIIHQTNYNFSNNVFLEPHLLKLKPKSNSYCFLESFHLEIFPNPISIKEQVDAENNTVHFLWFEGLTDKLSIKSTSIVKLSGYNPFDFIIYPDHYLKTPFDYTEELKLLLLPSLQKTAINQPPKEYVSTILAKSNNTMDFIMNLTKKIHEDFELYYRHEGAPFDPNVCFNQKKGSCRDLSWMQVQLLRNIGIAARFVSGYYYIKIEKPVYELHAWVEAYLPGAGWIGFDPSHGMLTGNTHISLASSSHFEQAMATKGTTRGMGTSFLNTNLEIESIY